ncbi:MAG: TolC family outer membrane protein [Roseateles sp.]|uniref:TolC family outer membrane protein n=1 Tax=Roseateles sp. TaxID=1971397 RepID=UPI0040366BB4
MNTSTTSARAAALCQALLCAGVLSTAHAAGLGDVLDVARASDAQFAAARAAAQSGRERLPQALAAIRPNVNLNYSMRRNRDGSTAFDSTLGYDASSAVLTVVQPVFRLLNKATIEQAEWQVQMVEQQLAFAEQDLLLRVARGYFDVLQAQDELAAATAQKDALAQQLAQAKRSYEVGTVPVTDFNEAQTRYDLARAQEIATLNDLELRRRVLERITARPLPPLARLLPQAGAPLLSAQAQNALVEAAPRDALPVVIARLAVEVATKEIARREAGHKPTLDLFMNIGMNRNTNYGRFGGTDTRQTSIGVEMSFPVYQGGAVSSRTREAIADRLRAEEELLNAQRQALLEAQQAQLGVQSGSALTDALDQALRSAETQVRSTQRGQQVGVRTRVDVLNAEQQLFATRRDLAAARYRTLVAGLQLKAAAGALREADLRALDALLGD